MRRILGSYGALEVKVIGQWGGNIVNALVSREWGPASPPNQSLGKRMTSRARTVDCNGLQTRPMSPASRWSGNANGTPHSKPLIWTVSRLERKWQGAPAPVVRTPYLETVVVYECSLWSRNVNKLNWSEFKDNVSTKLPVWKKEQLFLSSFWNGNRNSVSGTDLKKHAAVITIH